jgi:hypothetical protein
MARTINWTPAKLAALIAAREEAIGQRRTSFTVLLPDEREPAEFDCKYAGYLIEYVQGEFAKNPPVVYPENREGEEGQ